MYKFKRSATITNILAGISLFFFISAIIPATFSATIPFLILMLMGLVMFGISGIYEWRNPTFNYVVILYENSMVFEFSENDHRQISRYFKAHVRKDEILLSDVNTATRISLKYDDEVLEFLKKAQKE